jgi:hypothetical protein
LLPDRVQYFPAEITRSAGVVAAPACYAKTGLESRNYVFPPRIADPLNQERVCFMSGGER